MSFDILHVFLLIFNFYRSHFGSVSVSLLYCDMLLRSLCRLTLTVTVQFRSSFIQAYAASTAPKQRRHYSVTRGHILRVVVASRSRFQICSMDYVVLLMVSFWNGSSLAKISKTSLDDH